jgi:hypothetical protein
MHPSKDGTDTLLNPVFFKCQLSIRVVVNMHVPPFKVIDNHIADVEILCNDPEACPGHAAAVLVGTISSAIGSFAFPIQAIPRILVFGEIERALEAPNLGRPEEPVELSLVMLPVGLWSLY